VSDVGVSLYPALLKGLACAALDPGLRSVLVFDIAPAELRHASRQLSLMLGLTTGCPAPEGTLSSNSTDDELWGIEPSEGKHFSFPGITWRGLLSPPDDDDKAVQVVVIYDLARLSLAAARACLMLAGADAAHVERHGQHRVWCPRICWLAACASEDVGRVSPHLLDRFALRLRPSSDVTHPERAEQLLAGLSDEASAADADRVALPRELVQQLSRASDVLRTHSEDALKRVLRVTGAKTYHPRRAIALARLARACAQLDQDAREVSPRHVNEAARLIGLKPVYDGAAEDFPAPEPRPHVPPEAEQDRLPRLERPDETTRKTDDGTPKLTEVQRQEEIYASGAPQEFALSSIEITPYPEDTTVPQREAASLRFPSPRQKADGTARGPVVGVRNANSLHDLALVSTLLEAAKYQAIRRLHSAEECPGMLLSPADLRSYRRAPVPDQMLLLVLDYTCLRDLDWQNALLPHLSWAYVERANITVVQVGAAGGAEDLRAEKVSADSILAPRIWATFERGRGRATPLAHGLELALFALRHALQHGRGNVSRARLLVVSDGRGNVPLEGSRAGRVKGAIGREGIEDALEVARQIRRLGRVDALLLDPQPRLYPDLPLALAEALGATLEKIPTVAGGEH
jgi:magnesium chelatase subunit D